MPEEEYENPFTDKDEESTEEEVYREVKEAKNESE